MGSLRAAGRVGFLLQYFSKTGEDSRELQRIREDSDNGARSEKNNAFDEKPRVIEELKNPALRVQVPYPRFQGIELGFLSLSGGF